MSSQNEYDNLDEDEAEASGNYSKELIFDRKKYQKVLKQQLQLSSHEGFSKSFLDIFKRRNIQYFGTNIQEKSIPSNLSSGQVELPLITLDLVKAKLRKIPDKDRSKIGYIHFGAIRIHIKASFQKGLNTPILLTLMHNRIKNRNEALIGVLQGNLIYQNLAFTIYPGFSIPIRDLDTCRALNLCYKFARADLLECMHHSPFTIYTMVSYMISNSHIIDRFIDKDFIDINDVFCDVCEAQPNTSYGLAAQPHNWVLDLQPKPLLPARTQSMARFSVDGTTLQAYPQAQSSTLPTHKANFQFVTKIYVTSWRDGLIFINPSLQQNFAGPKLFAELEAHKLTYVPTLFNSVERIIHIEPRPYPTKAALVLGLKFLAETTFTTTDKVLTITLDDVIIQAILINE